MGIPRATGTLFPEVAIMARVMKLLATLDASAVIRVLTYIGSRYGKMLVDEPPANF